MISPLLLLPDARFCSGIYGALHATGFRSGQLVSAHCFSTSTGQVKDFPDRGLTHVAPGDSAYLPRMVDVRGKQETTRTAHARSVVQLPPNVVQALSPVDGQRQDIAGPKGAVFNTAIIAGVCGAKKTSDLIPFCHPLNLEKCDLEVNLMHKENGAADVVIDCRVSLTGRTGVEMEALVGASVSGLCIYDMLKALSHDIVISETKLMHKSGGKRDFSRDEPPVGVAK